MTGETWTLCDRCQQRNVIKVKAVEFVRLFVVVLEAIIKLDSLDSLNSARQNILPLCENRRFGRSHFISNANNQID